MNCVPSWPRKRLHFSQARIYDTCHLHHPVLMCKHFPLQHICLRWGLIKQRRGTELIWGRSIGRCRDIKETLKASSVKHNNIVTQYVNAPIHFLPPFPSKICSRVLPFVVLHFNFFPDFTRFTCCMLLQTVGGRTSLVMCRSVICMCLRAFEWCFTRSPASHYCFGFMCSLNN